MNNKAKGARRERQAKAMLEAMGYYACKAGGSLGIWDLIAFNHKELLLVQVKSNYCRPEQRKKLAEFRIPYFARKELWIFKDGQNQPLRETIY